MKKVIVVVSVVGLGLAALLGFCWFIGGKSELEDIPDEYCCDPHFPVAYLP